MPLKTKGMEVLQWPIDKPIDYPKNARKWTTGAIAKVAASIREFGFVQPIVVDRKGVIIIGHLRRAAARTLNMQTVPVHIADKLTPSQVRQLRLMDNRSHEEATWDMDLLTEEMLDLKGLDLDLSLTGFSERELDAMLRIDNPDEDNVPEVPIAPVTRVGDLWLLGEHRVLCGDSTSVEAVARLFGDNKAGLMNTDPPYGVDYGDIANSRKRAADKRKGGDGKDYEAQDWHRIENDDLHGVDFQLFLEKTILACLPHLISNPAIYLWHPMLTQGAFAAAAAAAADILIHRQIIWVKPSLIMGRGDYHWRHELCFYGWIKGHRPDWLRGRDQHTIWECGRENDHIHPTQKPVELFRRPILNHLTAGGIAYEPFGGSGSQVIAAELTERRCFTVELMPGYCDVIVTRWQNLTGKQATLEGHGATFEHVKAGRRLEETDAIGEEVIEKLHG